MKHFFIGRRIIKTVIAVFIVLMIYIILLGIDKLVGIETANWKAPSNMYTPFFAGIAAVFALQRDIGNSLKQARIRTFGSLMGGYFGVLIVILVDFLCFNLLSIESTSSILYKIILFTAVSIAFIPLIKVTVTTKQKDAIFITCLTYLSVTISIRNGGMPVFQFATNRCLSTIIGVDIAIFINRFAYLFFKPNKNVLFVSSVNNIFMVKNNQISDYLKFKLNDMYQREIPLVFSTNRSIATLEYIFQNIKITYPLITLNGSALYDYEKKEYEQVYNISKETCLILNNMLEELNMNAFTYSIHDHILHCYYDDLKNDGEIDFYNYRRSINIRNFVKGKLHPELNAAVYMAINTKEKIDLLKQKILSHSINQDVEITTYLYNKNINGQEFWGIRIDSVDSTQEKLVSNLKMRYGYEKLVVCAADENDLNLIQMADLSMCLSTAPIAIQNKVDIVINDNSEKVIKLFDAIYHAKNIDKILNKIKKKYKK